MILYEGPSLLTGEEIFVIATVDGNPKIGEMLCTWIMLIERPPHVAAFDGGDRAICGSCKYRSQVPATAAQLHTLEDLKKLRTCYVRLTDDGSDGNPPADEKVPPSVIWQRYHDEFYPGRSYFFSNEWVLGERQFWQYRGEHPTRIGSYGDPAAVPTKVWQHLVKYAPNWTGYTHQWMEDACDPDLKKYCMASVDTRREWREAKDRGWTSFIVLPESARGTAVEEEVKAGGAILCPMTAKKPVTCKKCCLCRGNSGPSRDIYEFVHGVNRANHDWWEV